MTECRYNGNCCVMYHRPFDSDELPCDGYDVDICSLYKPMPDVKALKGLAVEMDAHAHACDYDGVGVINAGCLWNYADRILEALGEVE